MLFKKNGCRPVVYSVEIDSNVSMIFGDLVMTYKDRRRIAKGSQKDQNVIYFSAQPCQHQIQFNSDVNDIQQVC